MATSLGNALLRGHVLCVVGRRHNALEGDWWKTSVCVLHSITLGLL